MRLRETNCNLDFTSSEAGLMVNFSYDGLWPSDSLKGRNCLITWISVLKENHVQWITCTLGRNMWKEVNKNLHGHKENKITI